MRKCFKCQINVDSPQDSSSFYKIAEFDCDQTTYQPKKIREIFCCESCWYHKRESENYLKKPIYDITHYKINQQRTNFDEDGEIQKHEILLINIYKEVVKNYNGNFDWNELQILDILSKQEKSGLILQPDEQTELIRLKSKYNLNNPSNNNPNQPTNSPGFNPKHPGVITGALVLVGLVIGAIVYLVKKNKKQK